MKKNEKLYNRLIAEVEANFEGWDFSHLSGRMEEFPLTWNYTIELNKYLKASSSMLDMGTGGGEFLSSLKPLPKSTCATEGYQPNIPVARNRLNPLGIEVFEVKDDSKLPFEDSKFDLIINKHEAYDPSEVQRILSQDGIFITQQVGGLNDSNLNELFGAKQSIYNEWCMNQAVVDIENNGLTVLKNKECITKTRFYDVGAIAYYLKCIPWQIEDFTVDKYFDRLVHINNIIEKEDYIDIICHRFLVIAKK